MKVIYNPYIQRITPTEIKQNLLDSCFKKESFNKEEVKSLIDNVKDIVDINYDGGELAIIASSRGDIEVLQFLIDNGADIRLSDDAALRSAAHGGHKECVKLLIENEADPKKLIGTTSYDNHQHIEEYLDKIITTK